MPTIAPPRPIRSAVKHGWIRFVGATRQNGRFGLRRRGRKGPLPGFLRFKKIDPVELTFLALELLAPALHRANTTGKRVAVTVPDKNTAEIFRAVLAQSQRNRATDRLIEIVVAEPPAVETRKRGAQRTH
jgi:hypothetical protein